jgi:membrane associated rhomboid family serine protease
MFIPIHDANRLRNIDLHYATIALIAINVAVFFLVPVGTPNVGNFMLIPSSLTGNGPAVGDVPEAVTLLTYSFLHYDFWHLAGNMIFLWVFGDNVEDAVGHVRFLLFYALCAIGGGLAHVLVAPSSPVPL